MQRFTTWQLFAVCVLVWSTTWHAITWQVGSAAAEVAVALRFGLAGAVVLAWCGWRGTPLRLSAQDHGRLALQGVFLYGLSYVCVYHAELHLPSGLVAVGYSASPLLVGLGALWLWNVHVTPRFVAGGLLGVAGVALMFWPEFGQAGTLPQASVALGAGLTIASVLLSAVGSLAASRNRTQGLAIWPALGFGMLYGALAAAVCALLLGRSFALPVTWSWWLPLLYLSLAGSVLTFACFLTLQDRVGPGRTSTLNVMTLLLALVVSVLFEGYRPEALTGVGVLLALAGNALMLMRPGARKLRPAAAAAE